MTDNTSDSQQHSLTEIKMANGDIQNLHDYSNAVSMIDTAIENGKAIHIGGKDDRGNENTLIINPRHIAWAKHYTKKEIQL